MQLVLRGQHRFGRGPGQAEPLGDQRSGQRAELLVVREHPLPAQPPSAGGLLVREAFEIEADQRGIAREREQVEAGMVETCHAGLALDRIQRDAVPVVGEQPAQARHPAHRPASEPRRCIQRLPVIVMASISVAAPASVAQSGEPVCSVPARLNPAHT